MGIQVVRYKAGMSKSEQSLNGHEYSIVKLFFEHLSLPLVCICFIHTYIYMYMQL